MKQFLIATALIYCIIYVRAQDVINTRISRSLPGIVLQSDSTGRYSSRSADTTSRSDTFRVIYIGADTSYQEFTGSASLRKVDGYALNYRGVDPHRIPWLVWQFGYMVQSAGHQTILTYKKSPISESFFVFEYRIIETRKKAF